MILALGRLHPNKAFDTLIDALAQVPEAYLWIAGEGPLLGELERQAAKLGVIARTRFLGWRDDVAGLFAAADLFVCPSRHEPLGNVVIEAWAQGKPVVAAAAQGPSQLIFDGENGLLTPVDDASAMAGAINRVLGDHDFAAHLGRTGQAAYQAQFTEAAVVQRYLDFLTQVAR